VRHLEFLRGRRIEEISNLLHVNLHVAHFNSPHPLAVFCFHRLDSRKEVAAQSRRDTCKKEVVGTQCIVSSIHKPAARNEGTTNVHSSLVHIDQEGKLRNCACAFAGCVCCDSRMVTVEPSRTLLLKVARITHHCVALAGPRLAICKHTRVIACKRICKHCFSHRGVPVGRKTHTHTRTHVHTHTHTRARAHKCIKGGNQHVEQNSV
jgi:hypothetical protein